MFSNLENAPVNHDLGNQWRSRSEFWNELSAKSLNSARGIRNRVPLILCGHGASLRIQDGTLLVRNGFTHFPQQREEFRFFKGSAELPSQIVILDGSGHLTFDVLNWLSEQKIHLSRISWNGEVVCVIGGQGYVANPENVRWQIEARNDHKKRMAWCIELIAQKIESSLRTLHAAVPASPARDRAIAYCKGELADLFDCPPRAIDELLGIEGNCAVAYFRALREIPIYWRGTSKKPIPEGWRYVGARRSETFGTNNRHASHPFNAMLNYAYGALESRMRIQAIIDGYDPRLGVMHESRDGASAYVFDIMEPERAKVDEGVIAFILKNVFQPTDFVLRMDGVVRLNPQLAKRVLQATSLL